MKADFIPVAVPLEDAPRVFGMSKSHLYRMSKAGRIDMRKVGRKTVVITDTVVAYLRGLPAVTSAARAHSKNPK
ncbi:hypothetical protein NBRC3280_2264 [Acetobacter pasteurianus NBRC 3280]|uniref:Helix-turn-helix domain-containing protein n=1 Tax=Acetobacter pasteurianus NBRC 3278 TaxID=1226660 RepID=A0A401X6F3_ACEPA|nr:helix-turn-helix domain-containing protein [Acetobacter pasteurianus]GCD59747.1 hypothetical protein NBRC3277_2322 [Acetobacter pasteurianus NBRC 3277]GCD63258.1 hypothetical protein NBRC3278_2351 [Acetobacter pasteurianus NBRC 3278]GCD69629.1 hypothetical protein NBRC3280_2264 [Acetobacter pasteurianus NBRC 3280]